MGREENVLERSTLAMKLGEDARHVIRVLSKMKAREVLDDLDRQNLTKGVKLIHECYYAFKDEPVPAEDSWKSYLRTAVPKEWQEANAQHQRLCIACLTLWPCTEMLEDVDFYDEELLKRTLTFFETLLDKALKDFGSAG